MARVTIMGKKMSYFVKKNLDCPEGIVKCGNLDLSNYKHKLPRTLKYVGNLKLNGYQHELPSTLVRAGVVSTEGYEHQLPKHLIMEDLE